MTTTDNFQNARIHWKSFQFSSVCICPILIASYHQRSGWCRRPC